MIRVKSFNPAVKAAALGLFISGLLGFLLAFDPPEHSLFQKTLSDVGHVPLFGLLGWAMLALFRCVPSLRWSSGPRPYAATWAITVALGALTEVLQMLEPGRDPDVVDFLRDAAGASALLLLVAVFDPRGIDCIHRGPIHRKVLVFGAGLALLAVPLFPLTRVAAAYWARDEALPRLVDFASPYERIFWRTQGCELSVTAPPAWREPRVEPVIRLEFHPGPYPGVLINEPYPDWTGYTRLTFTVFSCLEKPVTIWIRIHDVHHDESFEDRYNDSFPIQPGLNPISIPLSRVRGAPARREMDLMRVDGIVIFALNPDETFTLYLDAPRLER